MADMELSSEDEADKMEIDSLDWSDCDQELLEQAAEIMNQISPQKSKSNAFIHSDQKDSFSLDTNTPVK